MIWLILLPAILGPVQFALYFYFVIRHRGCWVVTIPGGGARFEPCMCKRCTMRREDKARGA